MLLYIDTIANAMVYFIWTDCNAHEESGVMDADINLSTIWVNHISEKWRDERLFGRDFDTDPSSSGGFMSSLDQALIVINPQEECEHFGRVGSVIRIGA